MAKVLCVDDSRDFITLIEAMIDALGHSPVTALSGKEALDLLDREKPDLICADMDMPQMSGEEMISRIRADPLLGDIPIIAITAVPKDRQYFIERGCDAYLSKPITLPDLSAMLDQMLSQQHV